MFFQSTGQNSLCYVLPHCICAYSVSVVLVIFFSAGFSCSKLSYTLTKQVQSSTNALLPFFYFTRKMDGEISISLVNLNINNHTLTVLRMLTICLCQCKSALFYKDNKCWTLNFKTFGYLSSVLHVLNAKNNDVFL